MKIILDTETTELDNQENKLYLFGFKMVVDRLDSIKEELFEEHSKIINQIPKNTLELSEFLNDVKKKNAFDVLNQITDYIEGIQRLYWHCTFLLLKKRNEDLVVDGYMDEVMWEDLGTIDALLEIQQYIEKTASEKELIKYMENVYSNLLANVHLSSLDQQDKFICLYTKIVKMYSVTHDLNDLQRAIILQHFYKENLNFSGRGGTYDKYGNFSGTSDKRSI